MKYIGEFILIVLIAYVAAVAATVYFQSDQWCHQGYPLPKENLSRAEMLVYQIAIQPGMALGCYLAEDADAGM